VPIACSVVAVCPFYIIYGTIYIDLGQIVATLIACSDSLYVLTYLVPLHSLESKCLLLTQILSMF
jgi:hypothetical protein